MAAAAAGTAAASAHMLAAEAVVGAAAAGVVAAVLAALSSHPAWTGLTAVVQLWLKEGQMRRGLQPTARSAVGAFSWARKP